MTNVLVRQLGPPPLSLANCYGTIKKTNKASLVRKLETNAHRAERLSRPSVSIIDGVAIMQKVKGDNLTFK